jgi:class 3 adenylate cyclase
VLATVVQLAGDGMDSAALAAAAGRDIERFKGRVAWTPGADAVAVFDGPARAIRYANALSAASGGSTGMRAGIQIGEIEILDDAVAGPAVDVARQLVELARRGQILATGTVRDLVAGSGIRFDRLPEGQSASVPGVTDILVVDRDGLE